VFGFLTTNRRYGCDARFIFVNNQGREMVSGDTLDAVGATHEVRGLRTAGGNRNRARLPRGGEGGEGGPRGLALIRSPGGIA
jgi:hypothetical protein